MPRSRALQGRTRYQIGHQTGLRRLLRGRKKCKLIFRGRRRLCVIWSPQKSKCQTEQCQLRVFLLLFVETKSLCFLARYPVPENSHPTVQNAVALCMSGACPRRPSNPPALHTLAPFHHHRGSASIFSSWCKRRKTSSPAATLESLPWIRSGSLLHSRRPLSIKRCN